MPFQIVRNDITKMQADAIVNPANPKPTFGSGIDRAVYAAAGEDLLRKRHEIGEVAPGNSFITKGYNLKVKYIIHTVGTPWMGGDAGEEDVIRRCYRSVFEIAVRKELGSLAIPLLASGSYGFPKALALRIALSEIESFLLEHEMELFLVVFDEKAFSLSSDIYGDIDEYINVNYVEDTVKEEYPEDFADEAPAPQGNLREDMTFGDRAESRKPRFGFLSNMNFGGAARKAAFKDGTPADFEKSADLMETSSEYETSADLAEDSGYEAADAMKTAPARVLMSTSCERSLDDVVKNLDKTFMELVFSYADERGMTDVEVQKKANLDRKAFSKLKCGTTKNPSKATALALAVALRLSLDETKDLLSRAGLALSPCSKQDLIVQYFIEREAYDIFEINIALFEHGEPPLGCMAS